jgi:HEAT repeat protein
MHNLRAIDCLLPLLESDIESDVLEAAKALGRLGSDRAVEPLLAAREREGRDKILEAIAAALRAIEDTGEGA